MREGGQIGRWWGGIRVEEGTESYWEIIRKGDQMDKVWGRKNECGRENGWKGFPKGWEGENRGEEIKEGLGRDKTEGKMLWKVEKERIDGKTFWKWWERGNMGKLNRRERENW